MKKFLLGSTDLDKWLYQNKATPTGDCEEGCLLDNMVVFTKRGVAGIYEHYMNSNSSCYYIEFEPGEGRNVWDNWETFETEYRKMWNLD